MEKFKREIWIQYTIYNMDSYGLICALQATMYTSINMHRRKRGNESFVGHR